MRPVVKTEVAAGTVRANTTLLPHTTARKLVPHESVQHCLRQRGLCATHTPPPPCRDLGL